ncbi:putative sulfate exporter family transporter [Alicyclobacillus herbarius]|uniref:putative sulfate exporter family transporter n=2 Tax=Alicyclobacillus herbarius TaxID=122960 RepID=UPI00041F28AE|nr:putative sulfate exporter family transporter [Alicyclobacillus herbarius]
MAWMRHKAKRASAQANDSGGKAAIEFPWFLLGFIAMSLIGSYVLGRSVMVPTQVMNDVSTVSTFILTMAMVGLGLNVSFADLRTRALRPFGALTLTSVLLSIGAFLPYRDASAKAMRCRQTTSSE